MKSRFLLVLAFLLAWPALGRAQGFPRDRQTRSLIQQAMEDYQNLEIDSAVERLQTALRACGTRNCSPQVLARLHISLGIVAVMGQSDTTTGVSEMATALQLDPNVEPDQLLVTPEITQAFQQARQRVRQGGGTEPGPGNPPEGGSLLHTPVPEQLENTPLPVYVEASGLTPAHVYVYFKGIGMTQFRRQEMTRAGNGYGAEIPCGQVIQPSMDYYVEAVNADGTTIGNAGDAGSPVHVPIVTTRTHPAPALPGRMPPETCGEECPPGMTGPQCRASGRGNRGLGDPCTSNNECGTGLHCDGGACAPGEAGETIEGPGTPSTDRYQRFSVDLGFGIGSAFLSGRHSFAEGRVVMNEMGEQVFVGCYPPDASAQYACSRSINPGFSVPMFFLTGALRYNFSRRIGAALGVRFQFDSADLSVSREQTLPNLLFIARLYYAFTPRGFTAQGASGAAFLGTGVGQIQARPVLPENERRASGHVVSGLNNVNLGVRGEYALRNGFHVGGEVTLNFMFATFLFETNATAFVGFHL